MSESGSSGVDKAILDRRDSPRVPMRFWAREQGDNSWMEYDGDLSVGGVFFKSSVPPRGTRFEIKLKLPQARSELLASGELIRFGTKGDAGAHIRFVDAPLDVELAIAKYLDDLE